MKQRYIIFIVSVLSLISCQTDQEKNDSMRGIACFVGSNMHMDKLDEDQKLKLNVKDGSRDLFDKIYATFFSQCLSRLNMNEAIELLDKIKQKDLDQSLFDQYFDIKEIDQYFSGNVNLELTQAEQSYIKFAQDFQKQQQKLKQQTDEDQQDQQEENDNDQEYGTLNITKQFSKGQQILILISIVSIIGFTLIFFINRLTQNNTVIKKNKKKN